MTGLLKHAKHPSFRIKIRHVFERLVKRFGYDDIEKFVPEEEKKMVHYIRKIQNNKKNKRESNEAEAEAEEERDDKDLRSRPNNKHNVNNEGDDDDDLDELDLPELFQKMSTKNGSGKILEEVDAEVIDFLDKKIVSHVSNQSKKPLVKKVDTMKYSAEGKMIFADSEDDDMRPKKQENLYLQAMKGNEDSFQRMPNGTIKFNKRKAGEIESDAEEAEQAVVQSKTEQKETSKIQQMLGRQYKAKVNRLLLFIHIIIT